MLQFLSVPYMQRAVLAGVILAVPLGLLGAWVVLRGLAFFAHAIGASTFPGVVVGVGVPVLGPVVGALLSAAAFAGIVSALERDPRVRGGAVAGIVLAAALAAGSVLLTAVFRVSVPIESILFGSLLAISGGDVLRGAAVAAFTLVCLGVAHRLLLAATFDREWAGASGAAPSRGDAVLLVLLAVVVVAALPTVGSLLVSGLLVLPAATARLVTVRLGPMMALSAGVSVGETVGGLLVARALDIPPGAGVAVLAGLVFGFAWVTVALVRATHLSRAEGSLA